MDGPLGSWRLEDLRRLKSSDTRRIGEMAPPVLSRNGLKMTYITVENI